MYMLKVISPLRTACSRMMETTAHLRYSLRLKTTMPPPKRVIVEPLAERELLRVSGDEVVPFLQGLVTNDMDRLKSSPPATSMYAMFLNKAGRVMYDTIIYRTENQSNYLIECDKNVSDELRRHLRLHRVRRKIDIDSLHKQFRPWIAFNPDSETALQTKRSTPEIFSSVDPRLTGLGLRIITSIEKKWVDVAKAFEKIGEVSVTGPANDCDYRTHRYRYGVGEGVQDLPPGKCFPLEANCDFLHGVSFNKGCYLGQELTARSHHTGVIRKRLMPLRLTTLKPPKATTVQTLAGANIGTVRGISLNRALALLRVEQVLNLAELMIDGEACYAEKPKWWPSEMAKKAVGSEN